MSEKDSANYFPRKCRYSSRQRSASSPPEYQTTSQEPSLDPIDYPPAPPPTQEPYYEHPDTIRPPATADTPPIEGRSEEIIIAGQFIDMENQLLGQYKPAMLHALRKDPLYTRALDSSKAGKHYYISDGFLKVNTTTSEDIIYIPQGRLEGGVSLREFILQHVHDRLGHFSAAKCYLYAIAFFWWPQMRQDFNLYVRSCDQCQKNKEPTTLPVGDPLNLPIPTEAYQSLAVDFAGPFPKSEGFESIFVIMDRFTSFTHLVPVTTTITASETFDVLQKHIFDIHGRPLSIVMDQDPRFTSRFFQQVMKSLSIEIWMATQYHHQTNGQVECRIRTIKQMMRNYVNKRQNDWC